MIKYHSMLKNEEKYRRDRRAKIELAVRQQLIPHEKVSAPTLEACLCALPGGDNELPPGRLPSATVKWETALHWMKEMLDAAHHLPSQQRRESLVRLASWGVWRHARENERLDKMMAEIKLVSPYSESNEKYPDWLASHGQRHLRILENKAKVEKNSNVHRARVQVLSLAARLSGDNVSEFAQAFNLTHPLITDKVFGVPYAILNIFADEPVPHIKVCLELGLMLKEVSSSSEPIFAIVRHPRVVAAIDPAGMIPFNKATLRLIFSMLLAFMKHGGHIIRSGDQESEESDAEEESEMKSPPPLNDLSEKRRRMDP